MLVRWARAGVLSSIVLAATTAAHGAAGGDAPKVSMLLPVGAMLTVAAASLLGQVPSARRIAALLLSGQAALHAVLELISGPASSAGMPGHAQTRSGTELVQMVWTSPHPGMLAAHVVAALVIGVWLTSGERAAWALAAMATGSPRTAWSKVRDALCERTARAVLLGRSRAACRWGGQLAPELLEAIGAVVSRRGPPALGVA
ncbi:hypothetical protein [Terrabacter sp. BE26]|uniref:hypothetical protein n=1 Tax=Terrabacter sp. BE26 TaxID=2898152 RepID=UPI0035BE2BA1